MEEESVREGARGGQETGREEGKGREGEIELGKREGG